MERPKCTPDGTIISPGYKSWVASRFIIVNDQGVAKRHCNYAGCNKRYSRGTSHMILKRHWSKQHEDFEPPPPPLRSGDTNHHTNQSDNINYRPTKKRPVNTNEISSSVKNRTGNQNINSGATNNKPSNNEKVQLDVKLVVKRLKEATSIHLTFDVYTPKKGGKSYGIITAHSLSDSLEIKSVLLEYRHLPYPNDPTTIHEFLRSCITKFNIREKIVGLASNCSNAIANAVQEVDKRHRLSRNFSFTSVHIKCFPQFVHLNVIEVLRSQENLIDSVRKVVGFINNNNFTLRPLQQSNSSASAGTVVENNVNSLDNSNTSGNIDSGNKTTGLKLPYDSRSSWNTTYNMIDVFIQQRGFIEPTLLYFQNPQDLANITIDWDRLFTLIQLLKPFHDVVHKFSVDNYTPVSLVGVSIPQLIEHLSSSWAYDDLVMVAHNFKLQLESYRQFFQSDLTVIAGLLDPRVKDTFISAEGRDDAIEILRKRLASSPPIKNETFIHHHSGDSLWSRIFRPYNYDEVADYLESPREHGYTSNGAYWEAHKHVYPSLYNLAKILLCVQATSVPCDRMFSAAENADREKKTQLESTNSKEILKSWAKYLEK